MGKLTEKEIKQDIDFLTKNRLSIEQFDKINDVCNKINVSIGYILCTPYSLIDAITLKEISDRSKC